MKLNWSRKDLVEENEEYYNIVTKTLTISLSLSYLTTVTVMCTFLNLFSKYYSSFIALKPNERLLVLK